MADELARIKLFLVETSQRISFFQGELPPWPQLDQS